MSLRIATDLIDADNLFRHHMTCETFSQLREAGDVHPTVDGGYIVLDYELAKQVLSKPQFSVNLFEQEYNSFQSMLFLDPPHHTRLRTKVSQVFTKKAVDKIERDIDAIITACFKRIGTRTEIELISEVAFLLPIKVICSMLGVAEADFEKFKIWTTKIALLLDVPFLDEDKVNEGVIASNEVRDYFNSLVAARRDNLGDDILSALIRTQQQPDGLNNDEIATMALLLFIAGFETTQNLIGNGFWALLQNRAQLQAVQSDLNLIESAIEECLRFDPSVSLNGRGVKHPVMISGVSFSPGTLIFLPILAINRDPRVFNAADEFNVRRKPNYHLTFSAGAHYCLGAFLARLETKRLFHFLLTHYRKFELAGPMPKYRPHIVLRGLESLHLQVG